MASNRITYNPGANANAGTAIKLTTALNYFREGRKALDELKRIFDKYNADFTTLATDLGTVDAAAAQAVYNLVTQAQGDVSTLTTGTYSAGAPTGLRQLVDAMG